MTTFTRISQLSGYYDLISHGAQRREGLLWIPPEAGPSAVDPGCGGGGLIRRFGAVALHGVGAAGYHRGVRTAVFPAFRAPPSPPTISVTSGGGAAASTRRG